jgi:hypothetical protein
MGVTMPSWHTQQFRIQRQQAGGVSWWVDLLLLDTVVRDILAAHAADIDLWRVHRRAAEDAAGHQFSFLYYAPDAAHEAIAASAAAHDVVRMLSGADVVTLSSIDKGDVIRATSDARWPEALQDAWPHYIMGVSRTVLALLEGLGDRGAVCVDLTSIQSCECYYTALMERLSALWQEWGSHAFLHHLNAVFGYVPVIVHTGALGGLLTQF